MQSGDVDTTLNCKHSRVGGGKKVWPRSAPQLSHILESYIGGM